MPRKDAGEAASPVAGICGSVGFGVSTGTGTVVLESVLLESTINSGTPILVSAGVDVGVLDSVVLASVVLASVLVGSGGTGFVST